MVHLKSCECYYCHRGIQDTKNSHLFCCCRYCGRITCAMCPPSNEEQPCGSGNPNCVPVDRITYLDIIFRAPSEELKLLDFGKWSPFRCDGCHIPIVDKSQIKVRDTYPGLLGLYCNNCHLEKGKLYGRYTIVETVYGNILLEVKSFFSKTISKPTKPTTIQLQHLRPSCECEENHGSHFNTSGESTCLIHSRFYTDFAFWDIKILATAFRFLDYVADASDLKLLTYSKWVDLRCSSCFEHFSCEEDRLPMFHTTGCNTLVCRKCSFGHEACCLKKDKSWGVTLFGNKSNMILLKFLVRVILELRGYFRNSGIDNVPRAALRSESQGFVSDVPSSSNNELGRGGQGFVRKEAMAVKEFFCGDNAVMKRMAFREVDILKKLQHPNIVKYYDSNWDKNRNMMTVKMEMCGRNLRHYIGYLISHEVQVSWSNDLLSALLYMKEQRVHHRDIKPENILTVPTGPLYGSLKLCDFGLARFWFTGAHTENQWCTMPYQDPDASLNPNNHCFESDLYSAGITLWEVVNRKHAYQFTHEITDGDAPLVHLIYKCTEPFQSARISVEDAYAEVATILKRDIGNTAVNFDEVFNVRREARLVEAALEESDIALQLSLSSS